MTDQGQTRKGRRKQYAIDQCHFYKLESKDRLAEIIGFDLKDLQRLAGRSDNYRVFTIAPKRDITGRVRKARLVQQPKGDLAKIHKRLFVLLSRTEVPDYLHSAVRGRSYISNAAAHIGLARTVKLDIASFYQSTKRHHVFSFFRNEMHCGEDAAMLLASLSTWDGVLPTGSPISTHLSFFAHRQMFEEVAELARTRGLHFSVYIDDLVLSGPSAAQALVRAVEAGGYRRP